MNKSLFGVLVLSFAAGGVALVTACSSDDPKPTPAAGTGTTTTVRITAAQGGKVADPGGTATLTIPAGALEKDTDITLKLTAAGGQALTQVYEFGPDGTKFIKPASLEIKADAKLAPEGKSLAVAIGAAGTFTALEGSTFANGVATAPIAHFTSFTVIFVDGKAVLVPPASCVDAASSFKPCGGDPKGTWTFTDFCLDAGQIGRDPFESKCTGSSVTGEVSIDRDVVFDATTITVLAGTQTSTLHFIVPLSCVNQLPDGGPYDAGIHDCATFQTNFFRKDDGGAPTASCADKGAGVCDCSETKTESKPQDAPDTYVVSGNNFVTTKATGGTETHEFCVSGNLLMARKTGVDAGQGVLYVLKRK